MKFILHIGRHKTGTSALQLFLSKNRGVLKGSGVIYPDFGHPRTHHNLAFMIRDGGIERATELISEVTTGCDTVIISSEVFSKFNDPTMVAGVMRPGETRVVLYVRDYVSLLASWYQQNIQSSKRALSFEDYVTVQNVSHLPIIQMWEKVYGKENLEIRVYDRERLIEGDIRHDFLTLPELQALSRDALMFEGEGASNKSIAGNLLFIKRLLNEFAPVYKSDMRKLALDVAQLAKINANFIGKLPVNKSLVDKINAKYREDRTKLAEGYGIVLPEQVVSMEGLPVPNRETLGEDWSRIVEYSKNNNLTIADYLDSISGQLFESWSLDKHVL
jgi:hypothetical protein